VRAAQGTEFSAVVMGAGTNITACAWIGPGVGGLAWEHGFIVD
jgi:hypothetical protein